MKIRTWSPAARDKIIHQSNVYPPRVYRWPGFEQDLSETEQDCLRALEQSDLPALEAYAKEGWLDPSAAPNMLHYLAIQEQGLPVLKLLNRQGFDVNLSHVDKLSPLELIMRCGFTDILEWYVKQGHRIKDLIPEKWVTSVLMGFRALKQRMTSHDTADQAAEAQAFWKACVHISFATPSGRLGMYFWETLFAWFESDFQRNPQNPIWSWVIPALIHDLSCYPIEDHRETLMECLRQCAHVWPWPEELIHEDLIQVPYAYQEDIKTLWEQARLQACVREAEMSKETMGSGRKSRL